MSFYSELWARMVASALGADTAAAADEAGTGMLVVTPEVSSFIAEMIRSGDGVMEIAHLDDSMVVGFLEVSFPPFNNHTISWDNSWDGTRIGKLFDKGATIPFEAVAMLLVNTGETVGNTSGLGLRPTDKPYRITVRAAPDSRDVYFRAFRSDKRNIRVALPPGKYVVERSVVDDRIFTAFPPRGMWQFTRHGPQIDSDGEIRRQMAKGEWTGQSTRVKAILRQTPATKMVTITPGHVSNISMAPTDSLVWVDRKFVDYGNDPDGAGWQWLTKKCSQLAGWIMRQILG